MLFTLKKLISTLIMPFSISFILLLLALIFLLFNKQVKAKFFLLLCFLWTSLLSYQPISNSFLKSLEDKYSSYLNINPKIEYVLVLGNDHHTNKERSIISQMSNTALSRVGEGVRIFKRLDNAKLIVSGYGGDDITPHAFMAKKYAIELGVDKNKILTQEKAKDTFEEAEYCKKIVGEKEFILVTSASHMPRAMEIFKAMNLKPIAAPTDYKSIKKVDYYTFPRVAEMGKSTLAMYEYIGLFWFKISHKISLYLN